jgi:hypothetical protein
MLPAHLRGATPLLSRAPIIGGLQARPARPPASPRRSVPAGAAWLGTPIVHPFEGLLISSRVPANTRTSARRSYAVAWPMVSTLSPRDSGEWKDREAVVQIVPPCGPLCTIGRPLKSSGLAPGDRGPGVPTARGLQRHPRIRPHLRLAGGPARVGQLRPRAGIPEVDCAVGQMSDHERDRPMRRFGGSKQDWTAKATKKGGS